MLFAHGAGAPSSSAWMQGWKRRLSAIGEVVTFDYPYMRQGRGRPDPLQKLIEAHRHAALAALGGDAALAAPGGDAALAAPGGDAAPGPLILAGKSMGSRVGCHLAAAKDDLARLVMALICFGYPLVGRSGKSRESVLLEIETPILFVQGTRDTLCPLDELGAVRARMKARSELVVVEEGDHSLLSTKAALKRRNETQDDVDARIQNAVLAFVDSLMRPSRRDQSESARGSSG